MIIVMGVSGCGKTTVGRQLATKIGVPFFDADDFHSEENIRKMSAGTPLNDADRYPWLEQLASNIDHWSDAGGAVLACSALKEEYRELLSKGNKIDWVYLHTNFNTIQERMKQRDHFMNADLLQSQFETLEPPSYGIHVDAALEVTVIISEIINELSNE